MTNTEEVVEVHHEHSIAAESLFHVGDFNVTNSLVNTWMVVLIVVGFSVLLRKQISLVPRGLQNVVEMTMEGLMGIFDSVTGERKKTEKFFPFVFSFFILILLSNWMGLLPGVGSIGITAMHDGHEAFVPVLRGGTADVNSTLALAIIGVVVSHIVGVVSIGVWEHFNKFVNIKALAEIPGKVAKDPMILLVNPITIFVGLLEVIGEFAKVASLSFRLFGNVFAGEVLLASMAGIMAFGLPIPFMFLEVLVGVIQAFIFSILVLSYMSMATLKHEH